MKKLILISMILCIAIISCASAAVEDTNATTTATVTTTTATVTSSPQLIGGDKGAYLINANVDGANVTFDNDYKGIIAGGKLTVDVYTTGTLYRVVTVEKAGYSVAKVNITNYPGKGETVVMNVTLVKIVQTASATTSTAAVMETAPALIKANATAPVTEVTTVVTTTAATTPSPTPTKAGSLPIVACAAFGLIGLLSLRTRR